MRQCGVLREKELFYGSDVIRGFAYKMAGAGDSYAHFGETDCFVCCSPWKTLPGGMTKAQQ